MKVVINCQLFYSGMLCQFEQQILMKRCFEWCQKWCQKCCTLKCCNQKCERFCNQRCCNSEQQDRFFGLILLISQVLICFAYGFFIGYNWAIIRTHPDYLIAGFALLSFAGFAILATYVNRASVASFSHIILIFGITVECYFLFFGMWQFSGLGGSTYQDLNQNQLMPIAVFNYKTDRQVVETIFESSLTECIACFISLTIAYSTVLGRVGNLEVYFLSVIGTIFYTLNSMIFWKYFITDCGFGMRVFLYGGTVGLFSSLMLNCKRSVQHPNYHSEYFARIIAMFGSIVIWALLPVLNWSDLLHSSGLSKDGYILHATSLNMWLALCGSVVGACCSSISTVKKLSAYELTFSSFTGGIAFSSSSDLYFNPGAAIAIGTLTGYVCALSARYTNRPMNKTKIVDSNGTFSSFWLPGIIAGVLSAIFQANTLKANGKYQVNQLLTRTPHQNGGYQMAGVGLSLSIGIFAGLAIGGFMLIFNRGRNEEIFDSTHIIYEHRQDQNAEHGD